MACPFFQPVARVEETGWIHAPRMPLGDRYRGVCQARPGEQIESDDDLCNCGYARGLCARFPEDAEADAVRFSLVADRPRKVVYVLERSHSPLKFGSAEEAAGILAAQARAFEESHRTADLNPRGASAPLFNVHG